MFSLLCLFVVLIFVDAEEKVRFTRFDVAQNRSLALHVHIDQLSEVKVEVSSLCRTLYKDEGAIKEEVDRCISMAFPTVRDYKLQALSKLSKGVADDATQMALQYAYEPTASHRRIFRVCAIGYPTVDSVMSVLYNSAAQELWMFSKINYGNSTAMYENFTHETATTTKKTVRFLYGDLLTLLRGLQAHSRCRLCDVLHFEDSDIFGPALRQASINRTASNVYSINEWIHDVSSTITTEDIPEDALQIVWVRNTDISASFTGRLPVVTRQGKDYVPHKLTAPFVRDSLRVLNAQAADSNATSMVRWKVSSTWLNVSRITAIGNYDGFTGRSYYAPGTCELHMREVLLGEMALTPASSLRTDHNSPHNTGFPRLAESLTIPNGNAVLSTANETIVVIAITFTIRVFAETAAGLRRALHASGYAHVYIVPDLTLSAIDYLQTHLDSLPPTQGNQKESNIREAQKGPKRLLLQIALGPHDIAMLLPHYLVFQMEQTWSIVAFTGHYKSRYALVLSNALCILAYSYVHADLLRALGYPCVQVVPLFSYTPETETSLSTNTHDDGLSEKAFDFLFYGGCSARRRELLLQIRALFPDCAQESSIETGAEQMCFRYSLHCVGWENGVFDAVRLTHVMQTRLVLNLHSDEDSVLEAHRLNYLLSLGKCIISERSGDVQLDARYASAVHFVNEGDLITVKGMMTNLLANGTALQECEINARSLYAELSADTVNLQIALSDAIEASRVFI